MFKPSAKHLLLAALVTQLLPSISALIDHRRLDPYSAMPQPRTLMISLFHPVPPPSCCPSLTSYMDPITATFEDEQYAQAGIPAGAFGSLTLRTCMPCRPSDSTLNRHVLLSYTFTADCPALGYIVVTIDHPYDAGIVRDVSFVLDQLYIPSVISRLIPRRIAPFMLMARSKRKNLTTDVSWGALWGRRLKVYEHGTFTDLAVAADLIWSQRGISGTDGRILWSIDGEEPIRLLLLIRADSLTLF
ncbi:uncharacterized protein P174DRAFT_516622 [Aspergillus novofumigatus IBT 16806]|uniref:Uncharacterized protein n=1 Tax=Aspergillus novofumigatus (strain IBT 16806) TaxID=1392255 RepID=A0A2I1BSF2_ASPN1|nr:uncharacterized protein P174DRAFT_516622 [Aspergillus novofumigatus IBT 16806]PKX88254.1 hypothetical protein P174DRAFT_516622 [Aspergillus novofumigatus IBT 16806]